MIGRKLKVRVVGKNGQAKVVLKRWYDWEQDYIVCGIVNLRADDADERLAEAKYRAKQMARTFNQMERGK